jgi:hypothetical protein
MNTQKTKAAKPKKESDRSQASVSMPSDQFHSQSHEKINWAIGQNERIWKQWIGSDPAEREVTKDVRYQEFREITLD